MRARSVAFIAPLALLLLPLSAQAQTVAQGIALFNILVGLMFTAACLAMAAGFIVYICRIGNVNRDEGLKIMEWGVSIMFVLIVLLAIAGFIGKFF